MDYSYWDPVGSWEKKGENYGVDAVYYAEVCIIHRVCKNGALIFGLKRGETFHCQFDEERYNEFAEQMKKQG